MRKSSLIFIFLLAGILNRVPAVAASDETVPEKVAEISSEGLSEAAIGDLPDAGVASETNSGLASESSGLASEAAVIEPVVFDAFAAEPFAGTSLMRMKRRLAAMAEVYAAAQTTADLSLAVAAAGSNDRFFRRNCEFLARLCRHLPFPALSSMLVFPEFLGIADELITRATRVMISISIEELQKDPARRTQLLKKLARANELALRVASTQRSVHANIGALNQGLLTIIARRHVNAPPADLLKTFSSDMCQIIDKYMSHWSGALNQFEQHHTLFANHLNYLINSGNQLSGVRHASQMSIMMRGFLDFKTSLEKYYNQVSGCPARLGELQKALHEKLDKYASRQNRFKVRVSEFSGKFPARDIDETAEPAFSSAAELLTTFSLLEELTNTFSPADSSPKATKTELKPDEEKPTKDLLHQLLPFVDGSIWEKPVVEIPKAPAPAIATTDKADSATNVSKNPASSTQDVPEETGQMLSEDTEQALPQEPEPGAAAKESN